MKQIDEFIVALLTKWKWRILTGEDSLWVNMLKARYGNLNTFILSGYNINGSLSNSSWWKKLCSLGKRHHVEVFSSSCRFYIGNGLDIPFRKPIGLV